MAYPNSNRESRFYEEEGIDERPGDPSHADVPREDRNPFVNPPRSPQFANYRLSSHNTPPSTSLDQQQLSLQQDQPLSEGRLPPNARAHHSFSSVDTEYSTGPTKPPLAYQDAMLEQIERPSDSEHSQRRKSILKTTRRPSGLRQSVIIREAAQFDDDDGMPAGPSARIAPLAQGYPSPPGYPEETASAAYKLARTPTNGMYNNVSWTQNQAPKLDGVPLSVGGFSARPQAMPTRPTLRRTSTDASINSQVLEDDDPRYTKEFESLEDKQEVERDILRKMDYRARRKHQQRVRIEFNIVSMIERQEFLLRLARALMAFGSPSHRIESQLVAAARILDVEAEFIHLPGVTICSFGDQESGCSDTHFIRCSSRLVLGSLHRVHVIYRSVVHDEISATTAKERLSDLLAAPPPYSAFVRFILAFSLSALICPLAFGGSFLDMWIAGLGGLALATLQICVMSKSSTHANVFEITVAIVMSFIARGLSSIRTRVFCYTAISSSAIIGILPGYLILLSSLELASKNIVCGSVKMVYALIYMLFLGFGLQIGSDFYLLFDHTTRAKLNALEKSLANTVTLSGTWLSDNDTHLNATDIPVLGTWTFTHSLQPERHHIVDGCFRSPDAPWYMQQFPWWTAFMIVPVFSLLSSLGNLQPLRSRELPVMVIISCASYASNKIANHYIFNRSDVVSAIGAFTIGLLGNIYSRKMGGTAFTSMVTGVLFLVPSGLSQSGGITAHGNGIDIGGAMIAVTIGITVGLFMSQALVYMFGSRKNAAAFSF